MKKRKIIPIVLAVFFLLFVLATALQVSFVAPTPDNNSYNNYNSIFVNMSVTETTDSYSFVDFDNSLLAWYRFNNETGENSTFFKDYSSYGNNATCSNCPDYYSSGKFGTAYNYTIENSDTIMTGNDTIVGTDHDYTISVWVNPSNAISGTDRDILSKDNGAGTAMRIYWRVAGAKLSSIVGNGTATSSVMSDATTAISAGSWYHFIFWWNSSEDSINIKVNNGATTSAVSSVIPTNVSTNLYIGSKFGTENFWNGTIDDLLIFNRILSESEISALYNATANKYYNNFTGLSDGNHTFKAFASNINGVSNNTRLRQITTDTTFPLISFGTGTADNFANLSQSSIYVNVSASDTNEANITFSLFNDTSQVNITTFSSGIRTINWTSLADGNYTYNVTITDLAINRNSTGTRNIFLDTIPPALIVNSPVSSIYNNQHNISINLSVSDASDVSAIWFFNGTNNITYLDVTSVYLSEGVYNYSFYANDSFNHVNITIVEFLITSTGGGTGGSSSQDFGVNYGTEEGYICNQTFYYILSNHTESDTIYLNQLLVKMQSESHSYSPNLIQSYIKNWQNYCPDVINRTLEERYVCEKVFYFLIDKDEVYTNSDILQLKKDVEPVISISQSLLKNYADNYADKCSEATNLKLPSQIQPISRTLFNFDNVTNCTNDINAEIAYYDMDTSLPLPKIYKKTLSCNSKNIWRWFRRIGEDENGYYFDGVKIWPIFPALLIFLAYTLIFSHKTFKYLLKHKKGGES